MPAAEPTHEDQPESTGSDDPDSSRSSDPHSTSAPHSGVTVELALHVDEPDPPLTNWLDQLLQQAAEQAGVEQALLSLAVVGDEEMAQLHEQYTGIAGTTDVLTFDLSESDEAIEGDIIVCIDEAARQAEQRNHTVNHELLLYAVHGLLHLLGEDDHNEDDYQRMHAREDALLEQLGIGRLFAPNPQPPGPNP